MNQWTKWGDNGDIICSKHCLLYVMELLLANNEFEDNTETEENGNKCSDSDCSIFSTDQEMAWT